MELTRRYLKSGHSVSDLIDPVYWQRYVEYYAVQAGEPATLEHMIRYLRADPYKTLKCAFAYVEHEGISPVLKRTILKAYPKLSTLSDLHKALASVRAGAWQRQSGRKW